MTIPTQEAKKVKPEIKSRNIHQRILFVMSKISYIQKDDKKVNNMYRFISHDSVCGAIHPVLVEAGITAIPTIKLITQDGDRTSVVLVTRFTNVDDPKDFVDVEMAGYGIGKDDKGPGKAISYAYKYTLLKTFVLETGEDPDYDQAPQPAKTQPTMNVEPLDANNELLSYNEVMEIDDLLGDDDSLKFRVIDGYRKMYAKQKIVGLGDIPRKHFGSIVQRLTENKKSAAPNA